MGMWRYPIYFAKILWWRSKVGKILKVFGYLRWDNTIEIHIASLNSPLVFQRVLKKTIRYAQEHGHLIEYTSAIIPYGKLMDRFGEAIVSVRPLGLIGQIWNGGIASKFVGNDVKYNVSHPLKVVIDPSKIHARKRASV
ncbi:hypothetical protein [Paenibacillus agricola]|uniref:hypothetical protein n=1 Tax=Paenibacillus agricola TaxID=2716264 RepID=UPI001A9D18AD|nr:hypothetical protein [Paenibacillus agricola]